MPTNQTKIYELQKMTKDQLKQIFNITQEVSKNDNLLISKRWSTFAPMRGLVDTPDKGNLNEFIRDSKLDDCVEFVKEVEGEIVSCVGVLRKLSGGITGYSPWTVIPEFCILTDVWTHPNYRSRGHIQEMIPLALRYAKEKWKKTTILLGVTSLNDPAKHIYESAGFAEYAYWMTGIPDRSLWKDDGRYTFDMPKRMKDIQHDGYCKQTFAQQVKFDKKNNDLFKALGTSETDIWNKLCEYTDQDKRNGKPIYKVMLEHEGRMFATHRALSNYPTIWHLSAHHTIRSHGIREYLPLFSKIFDIERFELERDGYLNERDLTCLWYPTLDCSIHYRNDAMAYGFIDASVGMYRSL